ncbi:MAG: hypothetical protein AAGG44_15075 [Planctomycetota bacterium]
MTTEAGRDDDPSSRIQSLPTVLHDGVRRFKFIAWFVATYSVLLGFLCFTLFSGTPVMMFAVLGMALASATLHLCSMWAAMGSGAYWIRSLLSFGSGGTVAICGMLPAAVNNPDEAHQLWSLMLALGPTLWFACQIPHFITRRFLQWRIGFSRQIVDMPPDGETPRIWDIMILTAVVAFVFMVGRTGFFALNRVAADNTVWFSFGIYSLIWISAIYTLLTLPAILLLLSPQREAEQGCVLYFSLLMGGTVILTAVTTAIVPPLIVVIFGYIAGYGLFFAMPLMFARQAGLELQRPRTTREIAALAESEQGD